MNERFAADYTFIKNAIQYLRNGNTSQKTEYQEKLHNRYKDYITKVIMRNIKIEFDMKDDVFNEFCCKLFDPEYLAKYRGDASFTTYIYPDILASIRKAMPKSEKKKKSEEDANKFDIKHLSINASSHQEGDYTIEEEGDFTSNSHAQCSRPSKGMRILQEDLEEFTPKQHNQEHLLGIKDLRAKVDQAIAASILKMSQIHPKDIRIFVMYQCDYSWEEIANCVGIGAKSASKRFSRSGGILEKFSAILIKTLWDSYKIDYQTVSRNFNALIDIE